jgi:hypothetical protein
MEGIFTLENLLLPNDYIILYDLKEAYNYVLVHPTLQGLLGI